MNTNAYRTLLVLVGLLALNGLGCAPAEDPQIAVHRQKYLLDQEPNGAAEILAIRETLAAPTADTPADTPTVMVARIGDDDEQTWEKGKAEFVVSQLASGHGDHGHDGHDAENCPFCKDEPGAASERIAVVRFLDDQGEVIDIDARDLFDLQAGKEVVVSGKASIDQFGVLVLAAESIFIR